jgi:hypothetical protein
MPLVAPMTGRSYRLDPGRDGRNPIATEPGSKAIYRSHFTIHNHHRSALRGSASMTHPAPTRVLTALGSLLTTGHVDFDGKILVASTR